MSLIIVAARFDTEADDAKMRISNGAVEAAILVTQVNFSVHTRVAKKDNKKIRTKLFENRQI